MLRHFFSLPNPAKLSTSSDPVPGFAKAILLAGLVLWVAGCGGGGSTPITNPTPTPPVQPQITSISPSSINAGSSGFTLTVNGSGFIAASVVQWNGSARTTTLVSSSQLQAAISANDVAAAGTATVAVATPGVGSGVVNGPSFTITSPPAQPQITSISPTSIDAGSGTFTLSVDGAGFIATSVVQWNGSARPTTFVSSNQLQAAISAADIATAGTATIAVVTPGASGIGNGPAFTITNPSPALSSITPDGAPQGSASFTLTVNGSGFVNTSVVQWNSGARPTTFISSTQLTSAISAADVATFGLSTITVTNPLPGGGTSNLIRFATLFPMTVLTQTAKDLVYDPIQNVIYLSVPGTAAQNPNTITVVDPVNATTILSVPTGLNPGILAISDDSTMLYSGIDGTTGTPTVTPAVAGSVQQFSLPSLTAGVNYTLGSDSQGPFFALDLQVAPGAPHTTAVSQGHPTAPKAGGPLAIFDDATARTNTVAGADSVAANLFDSLQWGADTSTLFAASDEEFVSGSVLQPSNFYTLAVDVAGVTLSQSFLGVFSPAFGAGLPNRIHYDPLSNLIYNDNGNVIDPSTGGAVQGFTIGTGSVVPSAWAVIDSTKNVAYFLELTNTAPALFEIQEFDLTTRLRTRIIPLDNGTLIPGIPRRLIRWGTNGLAFVVDRPGFVFNPNDTSGEVFILSNVP